MINTKFKLMAVLCCFLAPSAMALTTVDASTFKQVTAKMQGQIQAVQDNIPKQLAKQQASMNQMKQSLEGEIKASQDQVMQRLMQLQQTTDKRVTQIQAEITGLQAQIQQLEDSVKKQVDVLTAAKK